MRRRAWSPWKVVPIAVVLDAVLLFGAVSVGLRVPGVRLLDEFPAGAVLDYSAMPGSEVAPLADSFIGDVLGIDVASASGSIMSEGSGAVSGASAVTGSNELAAPAAEAAAIPTVTRHGLENDDFDDAIPVTGLPFTAETNTTGATREQAEPENCSPVGGTVWYSYTPTTRVAVSANTFGTNHATAVGVYSGTRLNELRLLGCESDPRGNAVVGFSARPRTTYYFQVAGPLGGGGLVFRLERQGTTRLVSRAPTGEEGNGGSGGASLSGDGRFVAFHSSASNLVPGDTNLAQDVFVHDRVTGATERVSVSSAGAQGNGDSGGPSISHDGRYVAFSSGATNLVEGLPTCVDYGLPCWHVFVYDRDTQRTILVSKSSTGETANSSSWWVAISANGRYVAFTSWASNLSERDDNVCGDLIQFGFYGNDIEFPPGSCADVFVHDLITERTTRVSVSSSGEGGDEWSLEPSISAEGRYVTFTSRSSNLVEEDVGSFWDIYVHDRKTGTTELVSMSYRDKRKGAKSAHDYPSISADGRYIAFVSDSSDLVPQLPSRCQESWNGSYPNDPCHHVYVHDRKTGTTRRVSLSSSGEQANHHSLHPKLSADGRYVAFMSAASNLVTGDTNGLGACDEGPDPGLSQQSHPCFDLFVRDLHSGTTVRVSVASSGRQASETSFDPVISARGSIVAFTSAAANLEEGDDNGVLDVFVHRRARLP